MRSRGASARANAAATRAQVSPRSRSRGVPSGAFNRYFMSHTVCEMPLIAFTNHSGAVRAST